MKDKNDVNLVQRINAVQKYSNPKLGLVIIAVIILQFYLLPLIPFVTGTDINKYVNFVYLYTSISYSLIVFSIIIFHNKGLEVFQDHFSLWTIVLTCFIRANLVRASLGGNNEIAYKYVLISLGVLLSIYIMKNRKNIKTPSAKSVLVGLLYSVGTVFACALLRVLLNPDHGTLPSNLIIYIFNTLIFQLSFVTVIEEACFRGLVFGFLVMNGYKENTALLIQAIIFWGMHYMKASDPILFLGVIPILALSTTLVIKKYKMLYLSIMIHTTLNVFGGILVAIL